MPTRLAHQPDPFLRPPLWPSVPTQLHLSLCPTDGRASSVVSPLPFSHPQPSSIPFYASFDSRPPLVHPLFQYLCCFGSCIPEFNKEMYRYKFHQFLHFLFLYWYSEMEESGCCFSIVLNFCNLSTRRWSLLWSTILRNPLLFSLSTWNFLLSGIINRFDLVFSILCAFLLFEYLW